jgi:ankyrin repeat protein
MKLLEASNEDNFELVKLLLYNGTNPDIQDKCYRRTALMISSWNNFKDIVVLLLEAHANPDIQK